MRNGNIVHFLFVSTSFLIGLILISQTALVKSFFSPERVSIILANENNCLQVGKIAVIEDISLSAVKSGKCSGNSNAMSSFFLVASTSVYLIPQNELTTSTAPGHKDFFLHFMIAISIVVLMFRTQIMEWEILRIHRTFDSSLHNTSNHLRR